MVDLATRIGSLGLPNPVMTASGTAGHGAELDRYVRLRDLGAVVVKSLAAFPWAGNPAPRLHPTPAGMLNSVGLQGPGVEAWLAEELPGLLATKARVVASIWGRTVEEFAAAADALAKAPAGVVAVEVNASCPNLEDRRRMFAHSPETTAAVVAATAACGRPRWAKLSPNVADLAEIAAAAQASGAEAVTLVNTVLGMAIDVDDPSACARWGRRRAVRAGDPRRRGPGRLRRPRRSPGPADRRRRRGPHRDGCRRAAPRRGERGAGRHRDVRRPRAPAKVLAGLEQWCDRHGVAAAADLVGAAHRSATSPPSEEN